MAVQETNLSQAFHQSVTRAQKVAELVASPTFMSNMRDAAEWHVIKKCQSFAECRVSGYVSLLPADAEQIKPAFTTLKSEFPDLNHFRVTKGGEIILDTKEDTLMRRVSRGLMREGLMSRR